MLLSTPIIDILNYRSGIYCVVSLQYLMLSTTFLLKSYAFNYMNK